MLVELYLNLVIKKIIIMPLQLNIEDDEQIELIKEVYSKRANEIYAGIAKLQSDLQKIAPILTQLGLRGPKLGKAMRSENSQDYLTGDYNPSFTWEQKGMYVLNKRGPLTAKQIVDIISDEYEPNLDKAKALNSLPATLSVSARDEKVGRDKNESGEYVYSIIVKEQ